MRSRQLYSLTSASFEAPAYLTPAGELKTHPAENVPLLQWPSGQWCVEANRYIRELYERGLSRRDAGGSLATIASQISHLLRFCWASAVDPISLNDNQFRAFVGALVSEKTSTGRRVRTNNTVIDIGRRALDFLHSVGAHAGDTAFVSKQGSIYAERREMPPSANRFYRSTGRLAMYWHHDSFPVGDSRASRGPIAKRCIAALRKAAITWARSVVDQVAGKSPDYAHFYTRDRRVVMLLLLEITGGRRREVGGITVASVYDARAMAQPMLRIPSIKKRGGKVGSRLIPISAHDLQVLLDYVEYSRRPLLRKLKAKEHGLLLVSSRTGASLSHKTITNEIKTLADIAKLEESVSPHLFRHRFITKLFISLIEQHQIENKDDFRRLLLDSERLKRKVMEWTGHRSVKSLEIYISYAFDEIADFGRVVDLVGAKGVIESAVAQLDVQIEILTDQRASADVTVRIRRILEEAAKDLRRIVDPSPGELEGEGAAA